MIRNIPKTPAGDHILVTLPYWAATTPRAPARRTTSTIQATWLELAPPSIPRVQPLMKRGYFLRGGAHKANDSPCKDDNSRLQNISLTSTSRNGPPATSRSAHPRRPHALELTASYATADHTGQKACPFPAITQGQFRLRSSQSVIRPHGCDPPSAAL